jgi:hypothetical protein
MSRPDEAREFSISLEKSFAAPTQNWKMSGTDLQFLANQLESEKPTKRSQVLPKKRRSRLNKKKDRDEEERDRRKRRKEKKERTIEEDSLSLRLCFSISLSLLRLAIYEAALFRDRRPQLSLAQGSPEDRVRLKNNQLLSCSKQNRGNDLTATTATAATSSPAVRSFTS